MKTTSPWRHLLVGGFFGMAVTLAVAHPSAGIVVDDQGQVFFSDLSRGLWKIDARGKLSQVHQEGNHYLALDAQGSFAQAEFEKSSHWPRWFKRRTLAGARPALIGDGGSPIVVGPDGNLYYVCGDEQMNPGGLQIARLTPGGKEMLLNPEMVRIAKELGGLKGLAIGPNRLLYATTLKAVLKITLDGKVTTVVNPLVVADSEPRVPVGDTPLLYGLAVDERGVIYVAASGCGCTVKITPTGEVTTMLKTEKPWVPSGVTVRDGDVYVLEHIWDPKSVVDEPWPPRVRKLQRDGRITTLVDFSVAKPR